MVKLSDDMLRDSVAVLILSLACSIAACNRSGANANATPTPALSTFESDLNYVRRSYAAGLDHIYVIARQDGSVLEKNDREFLRANIPRETITTVVTDNARRVIIGTNVDLTADNRKTLAKRFTIEDYTKK